MAEFSLHVECFWLFPRQGLLLWEDKWGAPYAHLIAPGRLRVKYLELFHRLGLLRKAKGRSALESAVRRDAYLRDRVFYRFVSEIVASLDSYFETWEIDADNLVRAKLDMMAADERVAQQWVGRFLRRSEGSILNSLVTYLRCAAFVMSNPIKGEV